MTKDAGCPATARCSAEQTAWQDEHKGGRRLRGTATRSGAAKTAGQCTAWACSHGGWSELLWDTYVVQRATKVRLWHNGHAAPALVLSCIRTCVQFDCCGDTSATCTAKYAALAQPQPTATTRPPSWRLADRIVCFPVPLIHRCADVWPTRWHGESPGCPANNSAVPRVASEVMAVAATLPLSRPARREHIGCNGCTAAMEPTTAW